MKIITLLLFSLGALGLVAQNSYNMNLLGQWDDPSLPGTSVRYNDLWGYSAGGRDYALMGSREKVHFIDVTNPGGAYEVAAIGGGSNTTWRDIKTYSTYAYAVSDASSEGLLVFDLGNLPASVSLTRQLTDVFTFAHNIFIDGHFAYIVGAARGTGHDLIIYDLTDPANPAHWGSFTLPNGYAHDIYVEGDFAYASHEGRGLSVYDLTNTLDPPGNAAPYPPVEVGLIDSYFNPGYNHSSWVSGNRMVMADETHGSPLSLVDVSDFEAMEELAYFSSNLLGVSNPYSSDGPIVHNPFIFGGECYVSHYHDGVVVFDISDPNQIAITAYYDTEPGNTTYRNYQGCWGVYPFLGTNKILASDVLHGLFVLQKTNSLPALPLPVVWGAFTAETEAQSVKLSWTTHEETQNKGFHVERQQSDGSFLRIGWVMPEPDMEYVFTDEKPGAGFNYYRIAQEDWDGSLNYSRLVQVWLGKQTEGTLHPNPVTAGSLVRFTGHDSALQFPLRLYGSDGRCLGNYQQQDELLIPAQLSRGTYYLIDQQGTRWPLVVR